MDIYSWLKEDSDTSSSELKEKQNHGYINGHESVSVVAGSPGAATEDESVFESALESFHKQAGFKSGYVIDNSTALPRVMSANEYKFREAMKSQSGIMTKAGREMGNDASSMMGNQNPKTKLLLSTTDGVTYRLYFTENTAYEDIKFQNKFVKLVSCLDSNQTLHLHIGNGNYGVCPVFTFGTIIDSIINAQCRIVTHINGRASFSETCLWSFGHERVLSDFSTVCYAGLQKFLESGYSNWIGYFKTLLRRSVEIGVLTEAEMRSLLTTNKCLQISGREVINRITRRTDSDDTEEEINSQSILINEPYEGRPANIPTEEDGHHVNDTLPSDEEDEDHKNRDDKENKPFDHRRPDEDIDRKEAPIHEENGDYIVVDNNDEHGSQIESVSERYDGSTGKFGRESRHGSIRTGYLTGLEILGNHR